MITLSNFKGINNKVDPNRQPVDYLRECVDFSIDNSGLLSQRPGYVLKVDGIVTTLWSDNKRCFAVIDGNLYEINESYVVSLLKANIGSGRLDFTECGGNYYFVGDNAKGVIKSNAVQSLGQRQIEQQPTVTVTDNGNLKAGTYLVAITGLDDDGMESGTTAPVSVTVSTDGKVLLLSNLRIPTDTRTTFYAVYVSKRDGEELYRQGIVAVDAGSVSVADVSIEGYALDSVGITNAPFGQFIAYHYGHLFIANGKYLFYSERFKYERWNPSNYYAYESNITAVLPVENGLWVGTEDGIYWVSGKSPVHDKDTQGDFTQVKKQNDVIKRGSAQWVDSQYIGDGASGGAWVATAQTGIFLMNDQGEIFNVSQDFITLPSFDTCAGVTISDSDSYRYVAIIKGTQVPERAI